MIDGPPFVSPPRYFIAVYGLCARRRSPPAGTGPATDAANGEPSSHGATRDSIQRALSLATQRSRDGLLVRAFGVWRPIDPGNEHRPVDRDSTSRRCQTGSPRRPPLDSRLPARHDGARKASGACFGTGFFPWVKRGEFRHLVRLRVQGAFSLRQVFAGLSGALTVVPIESTETAIRSITCTTSRPVHLWSSFAEDTRSPHEKRVIDQRRSWTPGGTGATVGRPLTSFNPLPKRSRANWTRVTPLPDSRTIASCETTVICLPLLRD